MRQPRTSLLVTLIALGIVVGVLPYALTQWFGMQTDPRTVRVAFFYPWNFSPLCAIALFAAASLKDWWKALLVPIAIRVGTDVGIWLITGDSNLALYPYQAIVYAGMLVFVAVGVLLRMENSPLNLHRSSSVADRVLKIGGAGLTAELLFFIVSNFGSWLMYDTYPHTPFGLYECYVAAIPFFGRSLLSTFLYSGLLFGAFGWLDVRTLAEEPSLAAERIE